MGLKGREKCLREQLDRHFTAACLRRRYKRFLADVVLDSGEEITVHCPNTGAMTGCAEPGSRIWLSHSDNPRRKYAYTWEWVETRAGFANVYSAAANGLVGRALHEGHIVGLAAYFDWLAEQRLGDLPSRVDWMGRHESLPTCLLEVKSVTLCRDGRGYFPDAVSERARRHVQHLQAKLHEGYRCVMLFCVQHSGIASVSPALDVDPRYAAALDAAVEQGLELLAYRAEWCGGAYKLGDLLPIVR